MSQHGCPERLSNRSKGFPEESGSQATMDLLVETLTGTAFEMTVSPSDTIFAIKSKIFRVEGIPVSQQHLLYNLKELEDSSSLRELSIGEGARLRLVLGMRGGPVSTRRLPPPAPAHMEPWPDIERLLDSNRDEVEWSGGGCKVTVLVFRDGERVNMLRVRENNDGTYSPLDADKYSSPLPQLRASGAEPAAGALRENAVTMGKMLELRRRMDSLTLHRAAADCANTGEKVEIQKTRSEEALPTHLRDEPPAEPYVHCRADEPYHHDYTRYSYECGFGSRYALLPPIGARDERAPDADAAHAPRTRRQSRREGEEGAILEECLGSEGCARAPDPCAAPRDLGELVGGCAWRGHSASALQLRAAAAPDHLHAPFSSSTSELENLKRNSRLLPGLSRARPREHLHLSDEGLHLRREPAPAGPAPPAERLYLRRERPPALGEVADPAAADERLYNRREAAPLYLRRESTPRPAPAPAPADEERVYRALVSHAAPGERLYMRRELPRTPPGFEDQLRVRGDAGAGGHAAPHLQRIEHKEREVLDPAPLLPTLQVKEKKIRVRCGWCNKRLSVSTVHACRCGGAWCAQHRYKEVHGCAWDYKGAPDRAPPHREPKLPKI